MATSSGTLSSLASCGWPSARTRSESTCFRRIRLRNPPPHLLPPPPLLPASNAIKDRRHGRTKNRPFSPDSIRGRIRASGWFHGLRGGWTERKTERGARGVDGDGKSSPSRFLGSRFPLAVSRAFFWYRLCWKLVRSENGADRENSL